MTCGFLFLSKTKKPLKDKSVSEQQRDTIRSRDELGNELLMAEVNHPPKDSDRQGEEISQGTTKKRGETIHELKGQAGAPCSEQDPGEAREETSECPRKAPVSEEQFHRTKCSSKR